MNTPNPILDRLEADMREHGLVPTGTIDDTFPDHMRTWGDGTVNSFKPTPRLKVARCPTCHATGPHKPDCTNQEWPS